MVIEHVQHNVGLRDELLLCLLRMLLGVQPLIFFAEAGTAGMDEMFVLAEVHFAGDG